MKKIESLGRWRLLDHFFPPKKSGTKTFELCVGRRRLLDIFSRQNNHGQIFELLFADGYMTIFSRQKHNPN